MSEEKLIEWAQGLAVKLSPEMGRQVTQYLEILDGWNQKIDLTAVPKENWIERHILDSLALQSVCDLAPIQSICDVGAGAGFPGIPLKIVFPHLHITLLDATKKRVVFLEEVVRALNLSHVTCVQGRSEEMGQKIFREKFDMVTARAVASLDVLSELCLPLVKVGGRFIAYKGGGIAQEVEDAQGSIEQLGGRHVQVETVRIPPGGIERSFVMVQKECPTPSKYPRNFSKVKQRAAAKGKY